MNKPSVGEILIECRQTAEGIKAKPEHRLSSGELKAIEELMYVQEKMASKDFEILLTNSGITKGDLKLLTSNHTEPSGV